MKKIVALSLSASAMMLSASAHAEAFSGPFIGIDIAHDSTKMNTAYGWREDNGDFSEDHEDARSISGISGGVFAGYDAPISGNLFAGVEVRANLSSAKYKSHVHTVIDGLNLDSHFDRTVSAKESFSATARIGYKINDKTGLYLRGGIAQTRFKKESYPGFPVSYDTVAGEYGYIKSATDRNIGVVYGAGIESKLSDSFNVRFEYNITAYGSAFDKLNARLSAAESLEYNDFTTFSNNLKTHQVRLGVSHSF